MEPTETPTPTQSATPTPTGTPEPNGAALYFYDGNGTMVKSIIGDVVTYYPSDGYQIKTDGENLNERKYYAFGTTTVAMRENDEALTWLLTDQINSTTVTVSEDGTLVSEVKYTAFGEVRSINGVMVTDSRYTGQREEVEIGLYYYIARYYDPELAHFIQADTIIPSPGFSVSYLRYAYVNFNPILCSDLDGHDTYMWGPGSGGSNKDFTFTTTTTTTTITSPFVITTTVTSKTTTVKSTRKVIKSEAILRKIMTNDVLDKQIMIYFFLAGPFCFCISIPLLLKSKFMSKFVSKIMKNWYMKTTPKVKRTDENFNKFIKNFGIYILAFWSLHIILSK